MTPAPDLPGSRLAAFDAKYNVYFAYLSVAFLVVILVDLTPLPLTPGEQRLIRVSEIVMYFVFVAEFLWRWYLSTDRRHYLASNWLYLVILVLPFLRPLMVLRVATVSPGLTELAVSNRGLRGLFTLTRGRQMAYLLSLTVVVVLAGTGAVFMLERGAPETPLTSFGETLWWCSTLITTVNSSDDPVTIWGRIIAVSLRIYAVGIFSYITATAATWLISLTRTTHHAGAEHAASGGPPATAAAVATESGPPAAELATGYSDPPAQGTAKRQSD